MRMWAQILTPLSLPAWARCKQFAVLQRCMVTIPFVDAAKLVRPVPSFLSEGCGLQP